MTVSIVCLYLFAAACGMVVGLWTFMEIAKAARHAREIERLTSGAGTWGGSGAFSSALGAALHDLLSRPRLRATMAMLLLLSILASTTADIMSALRAS